MKNLTQANVALLATKINVFFAMIPLLIAKSVLTRYYVSINC